MPNPTSQADGNSVTATLSIPEHIFVEIAKQTDSPTKYLEDFITRAYTMGNLSSTSTDHVDTPTPNQSENPSKWDSSKMNHFIEFLIDAMAHRPDIDILLSLLAAYGELGVSRPNTTELRRARGLGQIPDNAWNQELRTTKSRLTITAKRMGAPTKLFGSPYGKGAKRVHPIDAECLDALLKWKDRGIPVNGDDPTGLLAARQFEDVLKSPSPYHAQSPTP